MLIIKGNIRMNPFCKKLRVRYFAELATYQLMLY